MRRWRATARRSPGRTASRRRGGSWRRCSSDPPPVHGYAPGSLGAAGGRRARARLRPLARAVGGVMSCRPRPRRSAEHDGQASRSRRGHWPAVEPQSAAAPSPFTPIADYALPVRLPHRRAGRARRGDRLAVRPALRLAERVRLAARPRGRRVPPGAVRDQRSDRPHYEPGTNIAGHDLEDAVAAGSRSATRSTMGPPPRRGHDHAAHSAAGRRGRRPHARAHRQLSRGRGRGRARVRARVRLRARAGGVDAASTDRHTRRRQRAPGRRSACRPTCRSASRATASAPGTP